MSIATNIPSNSEHYQFVPTFRNYGVLHNPSHVATHENLYTIWVKLQVTLAAKKIKIKIIFIRKTRRKNSVEIAKITRCERYEGCMSRPLLADVNHIHNHESHQHCCARHYTIAFTGLRDAILMSGARALSRNVTSLRTCSRRKLFLQFLVCNYCSFDETLRPDTLLVWNCIAVLQFEHVFFFYYKNETENTNSTSLYASTSFITRRPSRVYCSPVRCIKKQNNAFF